MAETKYPSEIISLPSKGFFYPEDNPLASGEVEMMYMNASHEDILTSQNLIRRGVVIDKLLKSLVVDKSINLDSMLIGDKNALMVAARVLGYGKAYDFELDCPACAEHNKDTVDLTTLEEKKINFDGLEKGVNEYSWTLPNSKIPIKFKLLTQSDERDIDAELKALKKLSKGQAEKEVTTRLKKVLIEVDGKTERAVINKFVDTTFLAVDSLALREYLKSITPDIDMSYNFECSLCAYEEEVAVPMTVRFFWPSTRV
jgi:hypothetical protein